MLSPLTPLHFEKRVGKLFPIIREDGEAKLTSFPIVNDWRAVATVRQYERLPEFVAWAVHPFTGRNNVTVQLPKMNE